MINHKLLSLSSIALFLFLFSCEPKYFSLPTSSMEGTLKVGDRIWRADVTPKRNEIMVFLFPHDLETYIVKRLIANPGDRLRIENGNVFVNDSVQQYPETIQHSYRLHTRQVINERIFEEQDISEYTRIGNGYLIFTNEKSVEILKGMSFVDSVSSLVMQKGQDDNSVISDFEGWNRDHFGELYLPKAGDVIVGKEKLSRYIQLVKDHEGADISNLDSYQFKKSYCFAMGDNRHNSLDSRYFGLIPMELVKGVARVL